MTAFIPSEQRYDMPAVFGPSLLNDREQVPDFQAVVISFETTPEAAARFLAPYFRLGDRAVISFSRMAYRGVSYLGGRGYEELVVSVDAVYDGPGGRIAAPYMPVLWVSDPAAIAAGREYMGYAKIFGELPAIETGETTTRHFRCLEFGTLLLSASATGLQPITGAALERVRAAAATSRALGWKYIAGPEGTVDADYPTFILNRFNYHAAYSGDAALELFRPNIQQAPASARILAAFADLPILKMRRAFVGHGDCIIDRAATRRLQIP
jgi:acetoacetate decarboxylase